MLSFGLSQSASKSITPASARTAVTFNGTGSAIAETTVGTVTIPAGMLKGKSINVFLSVSSSTLFTNGRIWRIKLGGTELGKITTTANANSVQLYICDRGTSPGVNAQRAAWAGTAGTLTLGANALTSAIDTSVATTLTITFEMAASALTEVATMEYYLVELIS